jgi:hypothetical protein
MTSTKTLLATLTLALAVAAPAAAQAETAAPQLAKSPVLFVDPSLGQDTVAIAFRTTAPLARKGKGLSLAGGAGLKGGVHSIMTFGKQPPMYLSFLGPHVKLHVGHRYAVTVQLSDTTVTRSVVLQKRTTEQVIRRRLAS